MKIHYFNLSNFNHFSKTFISFNDKVQNKIYPQDGANNSNQIENGNTKNEDWNHNKKITHYSRPKESRLTKNQLEHTTILTGGLSPIHNFLFEGALKGLGIKCYALPNADQKSGHLGREYGNNGYCNPAYFTTGNLIKYLQKLISDGMKRQDIIDNYAFLTAGCGDSPCRFGMYESQYRQSLANAGFDGFRIIAFEQAGGMKQKLHNVGINFNFEFFLTIVNAFNIGDLLNSLVFSIRPYEIEKGKTDKVLAESIEYLHNEFISKKRVQLNRFWEKFFSIIHLKNVATFVQQLRNQIKSQHFIKALKVVKEKFNEIEVDRFRLKPKVKITGEFWATITHGDGNYKMYPFLEGEGAEVQTDYMANYLTYLLNKNLRFHQNKKGSNSIPWWHIKDRFANYINFSIKHLTLLWGEKLFKQEFDRLREVMGGTLHGLIDHKELQELAHPYYHRMLSGGEGYMEVGKNIYYHENYLTHMVLSIKPFGCMPSTLSDGVQVKIIEKYKNMIFLSIETSGEGEINAHSRVQMSLFDARTKAKKEFEEALIQSGKNLAEMKDFVENNAQLKNPFYTVPHDKKVVGVASNFILHLADLMNANTPRN